MKTKSKNMLIHSTPEKVFAQLDDFSKTGMHMSESSLKICELYKSIQELCNAFQQLRF